MFSRAGTTWLITSRFGISIHLAEFKILAFIGRFTITVPQLSLVFLAIGAVAGNEVNAISAILLHFCRGASIGLPSSGSNS